MSFEQAREAAVAAAREIKESGVRAVVEVYLTQVPGTIQRSFKRADDETGRTLPPNFALPTADDLAKLLPSTLPRFKPGDAVPGSERFVLDRLLGGGGFGEVWLARHRTFGTASAVKFFKCLDNRDRDLLHEGNVIARVMQERNPNVVRLLDAHLDGATPWLMYEYVEGGDLGDMIRHYAKLSASDRQEKVVTALQLLAKAVGQFHRLDPPIVHRDLKPANILYDRAARQLRIIDFGIGGIAARDLLDSEKHGTLTRAARLQSYLHGSYTPMYASPQQKAGEPPDPRDDVHALGVIAYQMLTCQSTQGVGSDYAHDLRDAGTPDGLVDLIGRCTARRVDRRPNDAREVSELLQQFDKPSPAKPYRRATSKPPDPFADIREDERAYLHAQTQNSADVYLLTHAAKRIGRWRHAAEAGFAPAQILYAKCLVASSDQTPKDAMVWYPITGYQGRQVFVRGSEYHIAQMSQALAWYRKAAEQGHPDAQFNLGVSYALGSGVKKDEAQAVTWYRKAAEQGHAAAQFNLGVMYEDGKGVVKDGNIAIHWYEKAAAQEDDRATAALKRLKAT